MRAVTLILIALLLLLQYPLWVGKGSWLKVWDMNLQLEDQQQSNQQTKARNSSMDAEVRDLKQGTAAIEERARSELGMVKRNEIFYQIVVSQPAEVLPADGTTNFLSQDASGQLNTDHESIPTQ
ncbi:MAG: cell division protein FtsB [Gallionella sp.]